jgi:hypothetical protein
MMQNQLSIDNHTKDYAKSPTYQFLENFSVRLFILVVCQVEISQTQAPFVTFLVPLEGPQ